MEQVVVVVLRVVRSGFHDLKRNFLKRDDASSIENSDIGKRFRNLTRPKTNTLGSGLCDFNPISSWTEMLIFVFVLCGFTFCGLCVCERDTESFKQVEDRNAVFTEEQEANTFLGRHLLYNRFDFEIFTPGNLERECLEEVCNYEEAREVFENIPDTDAFWKKYTEAQDQGQKIDVTALLVGLIAGGVAIIIVGLLIWYSCQNKCKNKPVRTRSRRSNAPVIIRRLEEVSLHPIPAPPLSDEMETHGLPTYDQAIAVSGPHDAPPPPYPGSRPGTIRR